MVAPTAEILKRPHRGGFMSPMVVLQLARIIEEMLGTEAREHALREAQVFRLPQTDEPVREEKAARLHAAVRRLWPDDAEVLGRRAGEGAGQFILDRRLPGRARQMLARMPRAAAAWLLTRRMEQQAWTFAGSGAFTVEGPGRFSILDNPLVRGERANRPVCHYHAGLFERQFRGVVHPEAQCAEVACAALGDAACVFSLTVPETARDRTGRRPLTSRA